MAAALAALTGFTGGCAWAPPPVPLVPLVPSSLPAGWQLHALPTPAGTRAVPVLARAALEGPPRWRLIVVPGSGCTGFAPIAARYVAAVRHADVWMLHKPGADVHAGAAPATCPPGFETADTLTRWQSDARAAIAALPWDGPPRPTWVVGISEGGELLPGLAPAVPWPVGLVLLSASGLDPAEAGALQAKRLGASAAWQALERTSHGPLPDTAWAQGRPLDYWRDLFRWRMADALQQGPWPLWQVWGAEDAAVPPEAYVRFAAQAATRRAPFCTWRMAGADHGLQGGEAAAGAERGAGTDGMQRLWARLDANPAQPVCPAVH